MQLPLRHLQFILLLITTFPLQKLAKSQSISDGDVCREGPCANCSSITVGGPCLHKGPLGDNRSGSAFAVPSQCRAFCGAFQDDEYNHYSISSNCSYCQDQEAYDKYAIHEGKDSDETRPQYCIPRGTCIEECGQEPAGCIYTGTCSSLLCFEGKDSKKPAILKRPSYDGPGTVLMVDNTPGSDSGTLHSTDTTRQTGIPEVLDIGHDYCTNLGAGFPVAHFSCDGSGQPLGDSTNTNTEVIGSKQCRSICDDFDRTNYEVLRLSTQCNFCNSPGAQEFINSEDGETSICIPQSRCRSECGGQEPQGCVYTGSCRSLICFSGLDSKKPASLSLPFDTGASSSISIDNSGDPISEEPAAFNSNLPSPGPTASPSPSPAPPQPESSKPNDRGTSIWAWLGPVVAVVVLAIVVSAVIAVYVVQRRNASYREEVVAGAHTW